MRGKLTAAAVAGLLAVAAAVGIGPPAHSTAGTEDTASEVTSVAYDRAGTWASPDGLSPTHWFNRPSLASARVWDAERGTYVTRLFRSVSRSSRDSAELSALNNATDYLDLGHTSTWKPVVHDQLGNRAAFLNFVQSGSELHTFDFIARTTTGTIGPTDFFTPRRTSTDGGKHWKLSWSKIDMGQGWCPASSQIRNYQGIITLADGTWVMPAYYGHFTASSTGCSGEPRLAVALLTSNDRGATWTRRTSPYNSGTVSYDEASVVQRADGRLLMVARYEYSTDWANWPNLLGALTFRISKDPVRSSADFETVAWSAPHVTVPGSPLHKNTLTMGVSPLLTKLDGRILMVYGRPGNRITWSTDTATSPGGLTWTTALNTHANPPQGTCTDSNLSHPPCAALGSSGYMGVAVTDAARGWGYIMGDNCHVWSCEIPGNTQWSDNWPDVSWPSGGADQKVWLVRFRTS